MIRVVVAEDSPTVRELLVAVLESDPEIRVVGQAANGLEAVELAGRLRPDLITMDVNMPLLDGFEATKEIMVHSPVPIVIVSSNAIDREVELSLNAIRVGALAVMATPEGPRSERFAAQREQLLATVKSMAQVKVVRRWAARPVKAGEPGVRSALAPPVELVAVAASTGGPAALQRMLADLAGDFRVPILVVQHIALGFVSGLASWLDLGTSLRVKIAEHGEVLRGRTVYLAPDGRHLGVGPEGCAILADDPAINGFRPSATYLFQSVARVCGPRSVAVMLTGMGADGVDGLRRIKDSGGTVFAQDETSSVVYGMPRAAMEAGVVDAQLPITEIGAHLVSLLDGGR